MDSYETLPGKHEQLKDAKTVLSRRNGQLSNESHAVRDAKYLFVWRAGDGERRFRDAARQLQQSGHNFAHGRQH